MEQVIRNEICLFRPDQPCDYHYHDGDEYWMVFRGHFTLNYEGHEYTCDRGRCWRQDGLRAGAVKPENTSKRWCWPWARGPAARWPPDRDMHGAPVKNRAVPESALCRTQVRATTGTNKSMTTARPGRRPMDDVGRTAPHHAAGHRHMGFRSDRRPGYASWR